MKVLAFPAPRRDPDAGAEAEPVEVGLAPDTTAEGIADPTTTATAATAEGSPPTVERPPSFDGQAPPPQYDRITVRAITVAIVLSLFVHILIFVSPLMDPVTEEMKAPADEIGPLSVTIAQARPQPPAPVPQPQKQAEAVEQPAPKSPARPPTPTPRTRTPASQPQNRIAINRGPRAPFVVPPPTTAQPSVQQPTPDVRPTPPQSAPTQENFEDVLAARQRARRAQNGGAPDEVLESDDERANRIAKANIAAQMRSASPGQDQDQAGGIFELTHVGINDAEFVFNGWNRDFRRKLGKTYDVRANADGDIRLAVIRQMILIIRDQRPGDFEWYNPKRGKSVVMSARLKDQPELELFLMKEFFPQDPRSQARTPPPRY